MPAEQATVSLSSVLGERGRKAFDAHKGKPVQYGGDMRLPGGIEGGVARLTDIGVIKIKEGKQNAGRPMFYARGTVFSPLVHAGVPVKGLATSVMEMLFDTPGKSRQSFEEHVHWVTDFLKQFGVKTDTFTDFKTQLQQVDAAIAHLKKTKPFFRFRTWSGSRQDVEQRPDGKWWVGNKGPYATADAAKKANPYSGEEPRVNETWGAKCDPPPGATGSQVSLNGAVDNTTAGAGPVDVVPADYDAPPDGDGGDAGDYVPGEGGADAGDAGGTAVGDGTDWSTSDDVDALVVQAQVEADYPEGEPAPAQDRLYALADERGMGDAVRAAADWDTVGNLLKTQTVEEPAKPVEPKKGETAWYKPPGNNPRTKKPYARPAECEVTAVDRKSKKVDLKDLTNNAAYKAVPWSALVSQ